MILAWQVNDHYFAKLSDGHKKKNPHWIIQRVSDRNNWRNVKKHLAFTLDYHVRENRFQEYVDWLNRTYDVNELLKHYPTLNPISGVEIKKGKDRKEFMRKWMKQQHKQVTDFAVRQSLRGTKFFVETGIKLTKENTPKEIIEARREQILMKRKLKQLKGEMQR